jgi:pyruvate carboxylase subunit B
MKNYFLPPEAKEVEPLIPFSPMPGGALTANTQMMRDNGVMNRYPEVIKAMGEVVRRGGFGTSVTPVSQFYFQQAYNNVMLGPWAKIADGYGKMVLGYFGKTPVAPDAEIVKICAEQLKLEPTTKKVLEINDADPKKSVAVIKKQLTDAGITDLSDENIFIAASCGQKGIDFLLGKAVVNGVRMKEEPKKDEPKKDTAGGYTVTVNGQSYAVEVKGDKATVNGKSYDITVKDGAETAAPAKAGAVAKESADSIAIKAPMPGKVMRINAKVGEHISSGGILLVIEAMKMEVEIKSSISGTVSSIAVNIGDQVTAGQALASIN